MVTVIDALVVTLGLNATAFKSGSKDAMTAFKATSEEATRTAKEMEARGEQAAQFFSKLRNEALALLAVFTAGVGITKFTEQTITSAAHLGMMADNLGMSTEKLNSWQKAAERAGGTQAGITAQLKESAAESARFKMGMTSESQQWFYRMGGDSAALKDGNSFLLERSRIISRMYQQDPTRAMSVAASMGISEDNFNLLKQGPDKVLALVEAQNKNAAVTKQLSEAALVLRNRWIDLRDRLEFTGATIVLHLMPVIEDLTKKFIQFADYVASHKEDIKQWVDKAVVIIKEFVGWTDKAAQAVGGWTNVIIILAGLKIGSGIIKLAAYLFAISRSLGIIGTVGAGAVGVLGTIGAAGAGVLLTPTDANKGEDNALYEHEKNLPEKYSRADDAAKRIFGRIEKENGLKPGTLFSMWNVESGKGKNMLSPKGAAGHFQHMPAFQKGWGEKNPYDLEESAGVTGKAMGQYLKDYNGDYPMALAAYNAGQGNVSKYKGIPPFPETRNYISKVMGGMEGGAGGGSQVETNFNGPITINTQATDAKAIAQDFTSEMNGIMATQANTGMN